PEQLQGLKLICASIAQPKADATSTIAELQAEFPNVVRLIEEHPIVSSDLPLHYKTIQQETANDAVLTAVVKAAKSGRWPAAD
uniref:Uncharacterized protein n=1 Tax=Plectus sambesii TaxID=2011161 RepID=A0A914VJM4_9BILA